MLARERGAPMIGHLVARVKAEKRATLADIDGFIEAQDARVRAVLAAFEARRIERNEDPFIREDECMDLEVRK